MAPVAQLVSLPGDQAQSPAGAVGYQIGSAASNPIGFFGATPVVQPAQPGSPSVATAAAGSTTAAYVNTTFTGGVGTSAYAIGDIVTALKNLGILAM